MRTFGRGRRTACHTSSHSARGLHSWHELPHGYHRHAQGGMHWRLVAICTGDKDEMPARPRLHPIKCSDTPIDCPALHGYVCALTLNTAVPAVAVIITSCNRTRPAQILNNWCPHALTRKMPRASKACCVSPLLRPPAPQ